MILKFKVTGRNFRAAQPQRTKYLVWEMKGGYEEVDKLASQTSHIEAIRNELWNRNCKPTTKDRLKSSHLGNEVLATACPAMHAEN